MKPIVWFYNIVLLLSHISAQWQAYRKYIHLIHLSKLTLKSFDRSLGLFTGGQGSKIQLLEGLRHIRFPSLSRRGLHLHFHQRVRKPVLWSAGRLVRTPLDLADHGLPVDPADLL